MMIGLERESCPCTTSSFSLVSEVVSLSFSYVLVVDLNYHHSSFQKEGCSEQELVHNVEDSFIQVHHELI
jgi:hypothetical protein